MSTRITSAIPIRQLGSFAEGATRTCLNCGTRLAGRFCSACGQREIDLTAPTWEVVQQSAKDAARVDGRLLRTMRGLLTPGRLTTEYRRGRRASYFSPIAIFLMAVAVLVATWTITRPIEAGFLSRAPSAPSGSTVGPMLAGLLAGCLAFAVASWMFCGRRRRFLNDLVFSLHTAAAIALLASAAFWMGKTLELLGGTVDRVPDAVPPIRYLTTLPVAAVAFAYLALALRRAQGGAWWSVVIRASVLAVATAAAASAVARGMSR